MSAPVPVAKSPHVSFERERGVYAVDVTRDVAHAVVSVEDDDLRSSRINHVFQVLANADIPIFLIKMHRTAIAFALAGGHLAQAEAELAEHGASPVVRRDLAIVTVRAASMRELHTVIVDITDSLYDANARLYEMGDSHNSVQCLIETHRVDAVVEALCKTFQLETDAVRHMSVGSGGAA